MTLVSQPSQKVLDGMASASQASASSRSLASNYDPAKRNEFGMNAPMEHALAKKYTFQKLIEERSIIVPEAQK